MPRDVPTFRPPGAPASRHLRRERDRRYSKVAASTDCRIRGRKGVELRRRRLANEPLCRHCIEKGLTTAAIEVDHIIPLAFGGTDTDDNVQCLCEDCHLLKSALEDAAHGGAANHPDWLLPSSIPLTIVCGPPYAGKSSHVTGHAKSHDLVIDLDNIATMVDPSYQRWTGMLIGDLLNRSIRVRNALLGSLQRRNRGRCWFIVSAPAQAERGWWQSMLGGEVVLLDPGVDECKRRAIEHGAWRAMAAIDAWYARSLRPWP